MIGRRINLSGLKIAPEDGGILLLVMPECGSCQLNPFDVVPAWFMGKPNVFAVFPDDIRQVSNTYKSSIPRDRLVVDPEFSVLPSSLFSFAPLVLKLDHLGTVIAVSKESESPAIYINRNHRYSEGLRS